MAAFVALALALVGLVFAVPAPAASVRLDQDFGGDGVAELRLSHRLGAKGIEMLASAAAPAGVVYVIAQRQEGCGLCERQPWLLLRFGSHGRFDRSYGREGVVSIRSRKTFPDLAIDRRGRPLIGWRGEGRVVERLTVAGQPDQTFGEGGLLRRPDIGPDGAIRFLPGGKLLLVGQDPYRGESTTPLSLTEVHDDGSPVDGFGRHHHAEVDIPYSASPYPDVLPDGSFVFFDSECCAKRLSLTRVTSDGNIDTRFDAAARISLGRFASIVPRRRAAASGIGAVLAGPDGDLELFGYVRSHGFELRLRDDGRLDTSYGDRGVRLLRYPVEDAIADGSGGLIAISTLDGREGVLSLDREGSVDGAFANDGRLTLPREALLATPTATRDGAEVVFLSEREHCRACTGLSVARLVVR